MSFKNVNNLSYSESKAILELFATLKNETNRYSKLCFSNDGKHVGLETASSVYRTTLSTVNYVTNFINQTAQSYVSFSILPTGWNRDIQTLIPITQQIAELFTTDSLNQEDAIVSIDLTAEAIEGLKALQINQYGETSQKADTIFTAINSLEGARNALIKNYKERKCCTHQIHANSLEKENAMLLDVIKQLREENDQLREQLSKKKGLEPLPEPEEIDPLDEQMLRFGKTLDLLQQKLKDCFPSKS